MTEQEAYTWIIDNENIIINATKFTPTLQQEFFEVYNHLSAVKKAQTSCSRCIHNMRVIMQSHLKTAKNMQVFNIYRTEKGNLSFKEQGEVVYTIRGNSQLAADEALSQIKAVEKRESKNKEQ